MGGRTVGHMLWYGMGMWPTTNDPRTVFVTIRLTASEAADLDAYAASVGTTRSAAVRSAVDRLIAASKRKRSRRNESG